MFCLFLQNFLYKKNEQTIQLRTEIQWHFHEEKFQYWFFFLCVIITNQVSMLLHSTILFLAVVID